jgi:hypothetical protein
MLNSPIKTLYCAYVRSNLEYGAIVWDPYTSCGSDQIERVQRKFLKYATYTLCSRCEHLLSCYHFRAVRIRGHCRRPR